MLRRRMYVLHGVFALVFALAASLGVAMPAPAVAVPAVPAPAMPVLDVPAEVSQGRAFVAHVRGVGPFRATLVWQGRELTVRAERSGGGWEAVALLGMPIDAEGSPRLALRVDVSQEREATTQALRVDGAQEQTAAIRARRVPWPEQRVTVEPKYVEPPADVQARIAREAERNRAALAVVSPERLWDAPLLRPVPGTSSGAFGSRRVFNGQSRAPHKGADLRGAEGTPVRAAAAGTVALAEPQYFSGNVIYLDHGQGVFTLYAHLSAFDVKPGDRVDKGQVIGRVGATGRVTGPHLHLGMSVLGVAVDAAPLFTLPWEPVGGPSPVESAPQAKPAEKPAGKS